MRLLCAGDVHLGASPDFGTAAYGPGSRLGDQAKVLERIARVAVDEDCDHVLFAGDAFHRRRPTPSEIVVWRDFLDLLLLDVIAVDGNHDVVSAELASALETTRPESSYEVSRRPQTFTLFGGAERVNVATLPWTPPARLVASRNGGSRDALNDEVAMLLIETARDLRAQIDGPAILLAHWSVEGASTPSGVPTVAFREPVLPLADLEALGFDAVVLGHIHRPQVLSPGQLAPDVNGSHMASGHPIFYVGSPCVVDFGEADSAHGVWILDTEDWSARFVPVEDRPFVTLDWLDIKHMQEPPDVTDAVVRVRYTATPEQAWRIDHAAIRQALLDAGAHKVYGIIPDIVRSDRARVSGVDETIEPLESLRAWSSSQSIASDVAGELEARTALYLEDVTA
jgi:exonuclease SbcD